MNPARRQPSDATAVPIRPTTVTEIRTSRAWRSAVLGLAPPWKTSITMENAIQRPLMQRPAKWTLNARRAAEAESSASDQMARKYAPVQLITSVLGAFACVSRSPSNKHCVSNSETFSFAEASCTNVYSPTGSRGTPLKDAEGRTARCYDPMNPYGNMDPTIKTVCPGGYSCDTMYQVCCPVTCPAGYYSRPGATCTVDSQCGAGAYCINKVCCSKYLLVHYTNRIAHLLLNEAGNVSL